MRLDVFCLLTSPLFTQPPRAELQGGRGRDAPVRAGSTGLSKPFVDGHFSSRQRWCGEGDDKG